jgi:hypothetical protein
LLALEIVDEAGSEVDLLAVRLVKLDEGDGSASRATVNIAAVEKRGRRKKLVNVDLVERQKRGKATHRCHSQVSSCFSLSLRTNWHLYFPVSTSTSLRVQATFW